MIGVAVIGAGHWGPNLIRNFQNPPVSCVTWVVDRDDTRLEHVRGRYPEVRTGADAGQAISAGDVDAVVIATPTSTHYEISAQALRAGKHVLVEKPIATRTVDATHLERLARERGVVLMVGHVFVYNAAIQWIKNYLSTGHLGEIYYIAMVRTNFGPIRSDVDASWDLAAHDISILNYWLEELPEWVSARSGSWINAGIHDVMFATLGYRSQIMANLHVSWLNPRKAREISIAGASQMLTFDDMNPSEPVRVHDRRVAGARSSAKYVDTFASFRGSILEGEITVPRVTTGEPLKRECDHFLDCIVRKQPSLSGPADGANVVRVLEAIDRSSKNGGRPERIPDE